MKHSHRFLYKSALTVAIASLLAAGVYAAFRTRISDLRVEAKPAQTEPAASADDLEAELITITPDGFEPTEITRPAGRFVLMFDNQPRLNTLPFHMMCW